MKYEITLKEIEKYVMEVEAENETEAFTKAYALIETDEGKAMYHDDSDSEYEAYDLDE